MMYKKVSTMFESRQKIEGEIVKNAPRKKSGSHGGGISGTDGISGARATVPGLPNFRFCCCRSRCSCSACTVANICNCCAINSVVPSLRFASEPKSQSLEVCYAPHSENPHDRFSAADFFLFLFLPLAVFDGPEVPL
jgi:hypothetical protein